MSWHLGFNTAASFTTNTNWQAYSGESSLSYFSQMIGLNFQNFVSAAVGIVVLFALIRGFVRVKERGLGNFYTDMTKDSPLHTDSAVSGGISLLLPPRVFRRPLSSMMKYSWWNRWWWNRRTVPPQRSQRESFLWDRLRQIKP